MDHNSGIIQLVKDATTIDSLKQKLIQKKIDPTLLNFFEHFYENKNHLEQAKKNFCSSLAAYSLACYILQIKDRHNGNIMINRDVNYQIQGFVIHIDYGFLLSNAPGGSIQIEKNVPFKMLTDYIDLLGGQKSNLFQQFRKLFFKGFKALRKHQEEIMILVNMMYSSHGRSLPCFQQGSSCITDLKKRLNPSKGKDSDLQLSIFIQKQDIQISLINQSIDSYKTRWYDKAQYFLQGIYY